MTAAWEPVDPFELPDWLGTDEVTWSATCELGRPTVPGVLRSDHHPDQQVACDLIAADVACPEPAVDERSRTRIHRAWRDGEVALVTRDGRLTLGVPGIGQDADLVLDAIGRLALAVGASPAAYAVRLKAGR